MPEKKTQPCEATMVSRIVRDHTHTCNGSENHEADEDHFCPDPKCQRWWYQTQK